jgi:dienelactone hydrolase
MRNALLIAFSTALCLHSMLHAADLPDPAKLPSSEDLPEPLVMMDSAKITTKEQWLNKRRPELKELFQYYMYGYLPPAEEITATIDREDRKYFEGKATKKEVTIAFGPPECPKIHLLLVIPNDRKGPAPVFVGMNFCGNHTLVKDPDIPLPTAWVYNSCPACGKNHATEESRGTQVDVWALEQSIARGYAVATFYNGDIDPDQKDKREGIQQHLARKDAKPGPHDWGTIAAWAWGIHRAVDYLVTDKDLDPKRIIVVGHSRLGKTALLAAAFDERIAMAIPLQAGCGGTAPSRGNVGESVKKINDGFPHWFCGSFKEFNDQPEKLPFDQHCLVALVAPRPVLFANATEDQWANPAGQFDVLKAAVPVYRLLGAGGLDAETMPEEGKLVSSKLGYYIRAGKHSMTKDDWKIFLDYADKQFEK